MLAKSVEDAVADLPSRFRCYVAERDAGAAGRHHQRRAGGLLANFGRNLVHVIGNDSVLLDSKTGLLQTKYDGGAGAIDPKPLKTRVADSDDESFHSCDFTLQVWDGSGQVENSP